MKFSMRFLCLVITLACIAAPAAAHHPMDSALPQTFMQGLLSGLGHPVIGLDHAAFIICTGFVCALLERGLPGIGALIAGSLAGTALYLAGIGLPASEAGVALSVILIGGLVVARRSVLPVLMFVALGFAGIFHGYAYGESIIGAEPAPMGAYLLGFSLLQLGLAAAAFYAHRWLIAKRAALAPRVCAVIGTASGIIGAGFLLGNLVSM